MSAFPAKPAVLWLAKAVRHPDQPQIKLAD